MLRFLLYLFVFFFIYMVIRFFSNIFRAFKQGNPQEDTKKEGDLTIRKPRGDKKIIDKDEGEYIKYEELDEDK